MTRWLRAIALVAVGVIGPVATSGAAPTQDDLRAAQVRLAEIEREFELVVEEYNLAEERLEGVHEEMLQRQLAVREIERRMDVRGSAAETLAVELYKAGNTGAAVSSLLSSSDFAELQARFDYLRRTSMSQREVFERLEEDDDALDAELLRLDEARADALTREQKLERLRLEVEAKVSEQEAEIAELSAAIERQRLLDQQRALAAAARVGIFATEGIRPSPAPAPNKRAQAAVDAALSQIGKPYRWGAEGPESYDCSGLTLWAWDHAGVDLPHNSGLQYNSTPRVARSDLVPGDLLFFGAPIHHVTMYIGNGQMVEAPYTGAKVRVVPFGRGDYVGAGRPGV